MYFIESFCGGSSQLRLYSNSIERIRNHLNKISKLRAQMISDSDKMNDEFGDPCKQDWEDYNNTVMDMTPENVHEYEAKMNSIREKEKKLWKEFAEKWIQKNNPDWEKFFLENSDFADISSDSEFHIYEIKEFPDTDGDFLFSDFQQVKIEEIRMNRRYNSYKD
jgi:hypothetical protein